MKLKMKKSLLVSTLALLGSAAVITPVFAMTACSGNMDTVTSSSGVTSDTPATPDQPTPPAIVDPSVPVDVPSKPGSSTETQPLTPLKNFKEWDFETEIAKYEGSDRPYIGDCPGELAQLNQIYDNVIYPLNKNAYDGFDKIATFASNEWTLNQGKTLVDAYNYFVTSLGKDDFYPTYSNFTDFFKNNPEKLGSVTQRITMLMYWYAFSKSMFPAMRMMILAPIATKEYGLGIKVNSMFITSQAKAQANDLCVLDYVKRYSDYLHSWEVLWTTSMSLFVSSDNLSGYDHGLYYRDFPNVNHQFYDFFNFINNKKKYIKTFNDYSVQFLNRYHYYKTYTEWPLIENSGLVSFYFPILS